MSNKDQLHAASSKRRLAEALARAWLKLRDEQITAASAAPAVPHVTQFAADTPIEPPFRYWDRLHFDPRPLDKIPAPLTPPLLFGPTQHGVARGPRPDRNDSNDRDPWSHTEDPLGMWKRKRLKPLLRDIGLDPGSVDSLE
jgi:hypothetical protein